MAAKGMTKAGPITLAVGLIAGGGVLLFYNLGAVKNLDWLWKLWPVLLIGVGLEYFIKRALIREEEVHFHVPSILLILILILSSGALYAAINVGRNLDGLLDSIPFHQNRLSYARTWNADPAAVKAGERLVIKNERGRVELAPAPDNMLRVKAVVRAPGTGPARVLADGANPEVRRVGEVVSITVPETGGWPNDTIVTDLEVVVPDGLYVRVENTAGQVVAQNAGIDLTVAGNTGSIEVGEISGNLDVRNNTGRIEVYNPKGDVVAETNTGSIELTSDRPLAGKYSLGSKTGRVSLRLPKDSDLVIEAESRTGRITAIGIPDDGSGRDASKTEKAAGVDVKKDKFSYTLGSGKGRADLRVGTGAINITVRY